MQTDWTKLSRERLIECLELVEMSLDTVAATCAEKPENSFSGAAFDAGGRAVGRQIRILLDARSGAQTQATDTDPKGAA